MSRASSEEFFGHAAVDINLWQSTFATLPLSKRRPDLNVYYCIYCVVGFVTDQERSFSITLVEFLHCGRFFWCQAGFQMKGSDDERTARFWMAARRFRSLALDPQRRVQDGAELRASRLQHQHCLCRTPPRPESSIDGGTYVSTFSSHSGDDGGISVCVVSLRTYFWSHLQTSRRRESRQGLSSPLVPVHTVKRFVVLPQMVEEIRAHSPLGFLWSTSLSSCNMATSLSVPSASCFPSACQGRV